MKRNVIDYLNFKAYIYPLKSFHDDGRNRQICCPKILLASYLMSAMTVPPFLGLLLLFFLQRALHLKYCDCRFPLPALRIIRCSRPLPDSESLHLSLSLFPYSSAPNPTPKRGPFPSIRELHRIQVPNSHNI